MLSEKGTVREEGAVPKPTVKGLVHVIKADLFRHHGATGSLGFVRTWFRKPTFRYIVWMRVAAYLHGCRALVIPYYIVNWFRYRLEVRYGVCIPPTTRIGPGLLIGHYGGIVVNECTVIGRNFSISHGVTIGLKNRGRHKGCPVIGDSVYVGPGACIIGAVSVGSNVAIGANAVVTHDIDDNQVVVGIPARPISSGGAEGYVTWTSDPETPE